MNQKVVFGILTVLILSGCGVHEDTIKIGSILILTGEGAAWGNAARNGIDIAVEEINSQGGINGKTLVVDHQDDNSDPKKALSAFQKLVNFDDTKIIIGTTWTHTGLPLAELAHESEVLMISPSLGVKEFNEQSEYLFNTWPHDFILSEKLADYVYEKGHRKVALIGAQNLWVKDQTNAFTRRFTELGGTIEMMVEPAPSNVDPRTDALKIRNARIDAVVSTTDGVSVGGRVMKLAKELGMRDLPMYSISIDQDTIDATEGAYDGMHFLTFLTPTPEFEQKYRSKAGKDVDISGASAYDAVMMLAQAMRETGSTDTTVLAGYLNSIETWNGASGNLVSDGKGGFLKPHLIKEVIDGNPFTI